ncbi:MAG: GGDEF domain-containing protein, partial [Acidimicrobiales bacterium]
MSALRAALRIGSPTPELGRAARSWGARFSAPVEALAPLSALREVVHEVAREADGRTAGTGRTAEGWASHSPATINHILDQVMLEAVDAASSNLRAQARTDPLTGCANRLALSEDLAHAVSSAARSGLDLALAAVDLDGLKRINDTKGHAAGDDALKALVARLHSALREADTLYRTGGDEFVVVAPFTDAAGAASMLERASEAQSPKFSWGVASMKALGEAPVGNPEALVAAADSDLYSRRRTARQPLRGALGARKSARRSAVRSGTAFSALTAAFVWVALGARHVQVATRSATTTTYVAARRHSRAAFSIMASILLIGAGAYGLTSLFGQGATVAGRASVNPSASTVPPRRTLSPTSTAPRNITVPSTAPSSPTTTTPAPHANSPSLALA